MEETDCENYGHISANYATHPGMKKKTNKLEDAGKYEAVIEIIAPPQTHSASFYVEKCCNTLYILYTSHVFPRPRFGRRFAAENRLPYDLLFRNEGMSEFQGDHNIAPRLLQTLELSFLSRSVLFLSSSLHFFAFF